MEKARCNSNTKINTFLICNKIKKNEMLIQFLRRKRNKNIKMIILQKKLQVYYYSLLMGSRSIWMHERYCKFWELDVPLMTDEIFKDHFRMSRHCFDILCIKLHRLQKKDTNLRASIALDKRVAISSSAEYSTISRLFGVGKSTVCSILLEFCAEVWKQMAEEYLPQNCITQQKISEVVDGFNRLRFPQCFGAIDGCHIVVHPPSRDTVDYYNYKGSYSTILFAMVDNRYRFMYINVGCPGRCNDSAIFERSSLKEMIRHELMKENSMNINGVTVPVLIIGDSAFKLQEFLMKPYPFRTDMTGKEKHFNYRLSKSRRVVENVFGHLKGRFRRIGKGLDNDIKYVNNIIKCCCVSHNFLNENNKKINESSLETKESKNQRISLSSSGHYIDSNLKG